MRPISAARDDQTARQLHRPRGTLLVHTLLAAALAAASACSPAVLPHTLVDANGDPVSLTAIEAITADISLSTAEQREQLRELGITDESLIDLLVR